MLEFASRFFWRSSKSTKRTPRSVAPGVPAPNGARPRRRRTWCAQDGQNRSNSRVAGCFWDSDDPGRECTRAPCWAWRWGRMLGAGCWMLDAGRLMLARCQEGTTLTRSELSGGACKPCDKQRAEIRAGPPVRQGLLSGGARWRRCGRDMAPGIERLGSWICCAYRQRPQPTALYSTDGDLCLRAAGSLRPSVHAYKPRGLPT